jgi:hypothetical protein
MAEEREISSRISSQVLIEGNIAVPAGPPVLIQQWIMEIVSRQPHVLMQKMGWKQKKQCYKELLSGYKSSNGTTMSYSVNLNALIDVCIHGIRKRAEDKPYGTKRGK